MTTSSQAQLEGRGTGGNQCRWFVTAFAFFFGLMVPAFSFLTRAAFDPPSRPISFDDRDRDRLSYATRLRVGFQLQKFTGRLNWVDVNPLGMLRLMIEMACFSPATTSHQLGYSLRQLSIKSGNR